LDIKEQIGSETVIVGDLNTSLSFDHSDKKINKETFSQKYTIEQVELTDIYRIFHLTDAEHTFFSVTHGTFSKIDTLVFVNKYKKIKVISCIFSDHSRIKLEIDSKKKYRNYNNTW
jgi:hypothetical protein